MNDRTGTAPTARHRKQHAELHGATTVRLRIGRLARAVGVLLFWFVGVPVGIATMLARTPHGATYLVFSGLYLAAAGAVMLWPEWGQRHWGVSATRSLCLGLAWACLGVQGAWAWSTPVAWILGGVGITLFAVGWKISWPWVPRQAET